MSVNKYSFVTVWKLEAPLKTVWDVISNVEEFPNWWQDVVKIKILDQGDSQGINVLAEQTWQGVLPYQISLVLRTTAVDYLKSIKIEASGELEGTGKWTFTSEEGIVTVQYNWDVRTTKKVINVLALFLKPLLIWNHDEAMRRGALSLANKLNARLIHY